MSGEAVPQLLDGSADAVGLSIISSQRTAAYPRRGAMYNPLILAAGVPVWFHPLQTGQYIGLLRSHWINATVGTAGPQSYSARTESGSCWAKITPPQGETVMLGLIRAGLTLNGAASVGEFLFTVGALDGAACVQHHRIGPGGSLMSVGEDILPVTGGVTFDKGCYIERPNLVVLGTDSTGRLYAARRNLSRIGDPTPYSEAVLDDGTPGARIIRIYNPGTDPWQYRGAKGWLTDPFHLEPIGLSSHGPVSVAQYKDRMVISTVDFDGTDYFMRPFQARAAGPFGQWKPDPVGPRLLGNASTYMGGTLYFQPQLGRNPAVPKLEGTVTDIPCISSIRVIAGSEHSISTTWGLWPIRSVV